LRWLADAERAGGARVVRVLDIAAEHLVLERLRPRPGGPTPEQAEQFGRALAATHAAGASEFGAPPPTWPADTGWLGPSDEPLPLPCRPRQTWGAFHAEQRILHTLALGRRRGVFVGAERVIEAAAECIAQGAHDGEGADLIPARLHGDLWSGNVLWTDDGAVLIDPAAHGGHRESDLAMLALFGAPHLARIVVGYDEVSPLTPGWQERLAVHQLHPVMLHAVLFGGSYESQARALARQVATS
jgi:fructosamine-3-kinase